MRTIIWLIPAVYFAYLLIGGIVGQRHRRRGGDPNGPTNLDPLVRAWRRRRFEQGKGDNWWTRPGGGLGGAVLRRAGAWEGRMDAGRRDPKEPSVPPGHGNASRWAPVAPIVMALSAVAVAAAGAFLLRRPDDIGRLLGPLVYILAQLGLALAMFRAMVGRAEHFAALGVPPAWTRPPLRGMEDADLRRWDNLIRGLRAPWPGERDEVLTAARARAEGLLSIALPCILAALISAVGVVLTVRVPDTLLSMVALPNLLMGLVMGWVAVRYSVDGQRARAYLTQFSTPAEPRSRAT